MELDFRKSPDTLAVLVVGTDTIVEALPARPIQLAHACGGLGFDLVIPLSWGDELVAEAALRILESRTPSPAILCACPLVRQRLLHSGPDLASALIPVVAPPTAAGRHLRNALGGRLGSLTYVGRCPSAQPPEYDRVYDPASLLATLRALDIQPSEQPDAFIDRLPPDRRRFVSLPGGCPSAESLWQRCNQMVLVELDAAELALEVAQHLLAPEPCLIDLAPTVGCHCSGVTQSTVGTSARLAASSLEPPRSNLPILPISQLPELIEAVLVENAAIPSARYTASERPPMAVTPSSALRIR